MALGIYAKHPPPSYISTDKSTYIDQIAHLCLLTVGHMPSSTAPVLDTCRNTMWMHMCRHIPLPTCRPLVHSPSPNCCISTAIFISTRPITHLCMHNASMMSTAT